MAEDDLKQLIDLLVKRAIEAQTEAVALRELLVLKGIITTTEFDRMVREAARIRKTHPQREHEEEPLGDPWSKLLDRIKGPIQ